MTMCRPSLHLPSLLLFLSLCAASFAQDPADLDKDRVARLEQLAKSLESVVIDRVQSSGDRVVEGRRASRQSELHVRFLVCVSSLENGGKDGVLLFPLQASGFTSVIDPRKDTPEQKTGADFQKVKVTLEGLIGQARP